MGAFHLRGKKPYLFLTVPQKPCTRILSIFVPILGRIQLIWERRPGNTNPKTSDGCGLRTSFKFHNTHRVQFSSAAPWKSRSRQESASSASSDFVNKRYSYIWDIWKPLSLYGGISWEFDGVVARHTRVYSLYCEIYWQEKDTVELGSSGHRGVEILSTMWWPFRYCYWHDASNVHYVQQGPSSPKWHGD